ncbi:hypothetical protein EVAR_62816_1 [Eumeta japonica]|uniref:Uncharacterized protein n=1 Tax=Eumeta variegata TaxID=151549 RepID=A0A4C2AGH2_EUMVA|nr:hypothetical protein EVAR_62816_1 [Eumeta japonica]
MAPPWSHRVWTGRTYGCVNKVASASARVCGAGWTLLRVGRQSSSRVGPSLVRGGELARRPRASWAPAQGFLEGVPQTSSSLTLHDVSKTTPRRFQLSTIPPSTLWR